MVMENYEGLKFVNNRKLGVYRVQMSVGHMRFQSLSVRVTGS